MIVPALATEGGQSGDNDNMGNQSGVDPYIVTVQYISEISLARDVFGPASATLPFGVHYLCYSPSQGQINFVFGRNIALENGEFYSEDCTLQALTFDSDGEHFLDYSLASSHPLAFSYTPGERLVFSDLGDYPALYYRKEGDYQYAECVIAAIASILLLYRGIVGAFYGRRFGV